MATTTTETQQSSTISLKGGIEIPRGETESELHFFVPPADGAKPFNYVEPQPEGVQRANYGTYIHKVAIHDIRSNLADYNIDTNGFGAISDIHTSDQVDFADDDSITKHYYPEVEKVLLDNVPGSNRVFIFDHTVRRADPNAKRGPVNRAHIDQTSDSARLRVTYHMGDEAEKLLAGRVRLINVWRPLNGPVVANPLAYADSTTVPDKDIVAVEHRYPHRTGETAGVVYSPEGKWHYLSGMTNDERILLQCYDSRNGARTPHSAFVDPRTKPDWPGRESIEVRALVFG